MFRMLSSPGVAGLREVSTGGFMRKRLSGRMNDELDGVPLVGRLSRSLDWKETEERKNMKKTRATAFLVGGARETLRRDANQGRCR
jgi:hypothetical protein